jgi:hypothetical protein
MEAPGDSAKRVSLSPLGTPEDQLLALLQRLLIVPVHELSSADEGLDANNKSRSHAGAHLGLEFIHGEEGRIFIKGQALGMIFLESDLTNEAPKRSMHELFCIRFEFGASS